MTLNVDSITSVNVFAVIILLFSKLSICINILRVYIGCVETEGPAVTFARTSAISCRIQLILI